MRIVSKTAKSSFRDSKYRSKQRKYIKYHIKLADHAAASWSAGASSTKQGSSSKKTHFAGSRPIEGSIVLKINKNWG